MSYESLKWCALVGALVLACSEGGAPEERAPASDPPPRQVEVDLCLAAADGGAEVDLAIQRRQALARAEPSQAERWVDVGRGWKSKAQLSADPGFYLYAGACVDRALEVQPGFTPALELRTLVLLDAHEFEAARELARGIVERDPNSAQGWASLSDALLELGEVERAREAAQELAERSPSMAAHARASYFRWLEGDIAGANKAILRALRSGRDVKRPYPTALAFVRAAEISWHRADYTGAKALYEESLRWLPGFELARLGLARTEVALGDPQAALVRLRALDREEPNPEVAWLLGDVEHMLGDVDAAEAAWARVEQLAGVSDPLLLARFLATKDRDPQRALELITAERRVRATIYVDDVEGWVLYRLGRIEEALAASERAVRLGTPDAQLLYHRGAILIASGATESGRALVEQALALNPHFDYASAREARELLGDHGEASNPS